MSEGAQNPAPDITKTYTNGEITVVWKPNVCVHSKVCWTQLIEVFNPKKRPWVNMAGASTQRIAEQVDRCPSGALSYFRNEEPQQPETVQAESLVEPVPNGPLLVYGNLRVKDAEGHETQKNKVTAFCRCGASSNKPYCDGSHLKVGFVG
ncbi:(4Fe-4S)-binding protein [Spirosoma validum]|uniref:(4Fe-4S)-binding protein n=1 Tax=Spirosoma validum TaxID=2771355 RepID=A0A927GFD5_9BACT|nr:(4Fe-4S)-binding protein [Spirosoma validum]MBD2755651.1 (4Fe-4S)-binding protein [Spirosoma validum]